MTIKISGNTESLRAGILAEIEDLYDLETDSSEFLPDILAVRLASITGRINREIAVYINRKGSITDICVGDSSTVSLSEVDGRRGNMRLSGIRCVHTHPNGEGMLSAVDMNSMINLNLDAMTALGVRGGLMVEAYTSLPSAEGSGSRPEIFGPFDECSQMDFLFDLISERNRIPSTIPENNQAVEEKAILVGLELSTGRLLNGRSEAERSLEELQELSRTAGLTVLEKVMQKRVSRDAAYYIGRGRIEEIGLMVQALGADTLVFDGELSGAQVRNMEAVTGAKVIDRTTLILDIFAQRARSSEGKLQVELAQLKYRLPRLIGLGGQLSRLGGGIGTRGPGEKKLEVDRRHIRRRISSLEDELENIGRRRGLMREGRKQNSVPVIALVGYTNSGKSTLMNRLCDSDVFAEDKLFATLDPTTRKFVLPDRGNALLIDTVGFIRKLPHDLIEAFKSTLEEVIFADLLLHVVDASDEEAEEQMLVAEDILRGLGAYNKPTLIVLNKMDLTGAGLRLPALNPGVNTVEVSALTGYGTEELLTVLAKLIPADELEVELRVPYSEGWIMPYIHKNGKLLKEEYSEKGMNIKAKIKRAYIEKLREFVVQVK